MYYRFARPVTSILMAIDTKPFPYFRAALIACFAITLARLYYLYVSPITLFADEAQYWTWAKHLDFGYYSKPPVIAWLIAATTGLCGDSTFCVRLSAPLLHGGTALLLYAVGTRAFSPRVGYWSAITYLLLPGINVSAFLIATDAPLLFCWAAALYCLLRARENNGWRWWTGLGLAIGLGTLSKYTMVLFPLSYLLYLVLTPASRQGLRNPRLYAALAVAAACYAPNLAWNAAHGFVTYRHTQANADLASAAPAAEEPRITPAKAKTPPKFSHCIGSEVTESAEPEGAISQMAEVKKAFTDMISPGAPSSTATLLDAETRDTLVKKLNFFLSQFGVFGPILFTALLWMLLADRRAAFSREPERLFTLLLLPIFLMILSVSLLSRAHANWAAPMYISGTVLVCSYLAQGKRVRLLVATLLLHGLVAGGYSNFETLRNAYPATFATKADPFLRMRGWDELAKALRAYQEKYPGAMLLTDDRKTIAVLMYELRDADGTPAHIFKWNPSGKIGDYYDMANNISDTTAKEFLLITKPSMNACIIAERFASSKELGVIDTPVARGTNLTYAVDYLRGFLGYGAHK